MVMRKDEPVDNQKGKKPEILRSITSNRKEAVILNAASTILGSKITEMLAVILDVPRDQVREMMIIVGLECEEVGYAVLPADIDSLTSRPGFTKEGLLTLLSLLVTFGLIVEQDYQEKP